jgi:hypothetical protein
VGCIDWKKQQENQLLPVVIPLPAFPAHSPITNHLQPYSGLAIAEPALKQSPFYVNCGPKVRRQQRR